MFLILNLKIVYVYSFYWIMRKVSMVVFFYLKENCSVYLFIYYWKKGNFYWNI